MEWQSYNIMLLLLPAALPPVPAPPPSTCPSTFPFDPSRLATLLVALTPPFGSPATCAFPTRVCLRPPLREEPFLDTASAPETPSSSGERLWEVFEVDDSAA